MSMEVKQSTSPKVVAMYDGEGKLMAIFSSISAAVRLLNNPKFNATSIGRSAREVINGVEGYHFRYAPAHSEVVDRIKVDRPRKQLLVKALDIPVVECNSSGSLIRFYFSIENAAKIGKVTIKALRAYLNSPYHKTNTIGGKYYRGATSEEIDHYGKT